MQNPSLAFGVFFDFSEVVSRAAFHVLSWLGARRAKYLNPHYC